MVSGEEVIEREGRGSSGLIFSLEKGFLTVVMC
jgi:hypothetical protein